MMHSSPDQNPPAKALWRRLDRVAGEMNALLLLLALGLASLDLSCFIAFKIAGMPMSRINIAAEGPGAILFRPAATPQ
jgi:hypothetical protein